MTYKYTSGELNEAIELLMEMRDNCVRKETDIYIMIQNVTQNIKH